jgi:hypothetical protein
MENFFIKCDDATLISDKKQYKEASFWERLKLSYHLMVCKNCKVYPSQNEILTKVLVYKSEQDKVSQKNLSDSDKSKMKKELQKSL